MTKKDEASFKKTKWCVTEKVHGSNFSIIIHLPLLQVEFAKRTAILSAEEDFFSYKKIKPTLEESIKLLANLIQTKVPYIQSKVEVSRNIVQVYGELYGGYYPHSDVKSDPTINPIQKGIYYSNKINFVAYDCAIDGQYIDFDITLKLLEQSNFQTIKPLLIGSFKECLDFNSKFESKIYLGHGLPKISNNYAEGIVIKPMKELLVTNKHGSLIRPIIKNKIPEFKEEPINLDKIPFEQAIKECINKNRVDAYISKIGESSCSKDKEAASMAIFDDIIQTCSQIDGFEKWFSSLAEDNKFRIMYEAIDIIDKLI